MWTSTKFVPGISFSMVSQLVILATLFNETVKIKLIFPIILVIQGDLVITLLIFITYLECLIKAENKKKSFFTYTDDLLQNRHYYDDKKCFW